MEMFLPYRKEIIIMCIQVTAKQIAGNIRVRTNRVTSTKILTFVVNSTAHLTPIISIY